VSQDEHSYARFLKSLFGDNKLVSSDNIDNNVDKQQSQQQYEKEEQDKCQVVSEIPSTTVKDEEDCDVDIEMSD